MNAFIAHEVEVKIEGWASSKCVMVLGIDEVWSDLEWARIGPSCLQCGENGAGHSGFSRAALDGGDDHTVRER